MATSNEQAAQSAEDFPSSFTIQNFQDVQDAFEEVSNMLLLQGPCFQLQSTNTNHLNCLYFINSGR